MARIYNKEQYGDQFQGYAQGRAFNPEQAIDRSNQIKQAAAQDIEDVKTLARADARQAGLDMQHAQASAAMERAQANVDAKKLQGILSLTKTGMGLFQDMAKLREQQQLEQEKQQQQDMLLDSIGFGGQGVTVPEEVFQADKDARLQVGVEAQAINEVAGEIKSQGTAESLDIGHQLQQSATYRGLQSVNGNAYSARAAHGAYLQEAMRALPDNLKPRTYAEADAIVRQLNKKFIEQTGVGGNPALVAKVLAPTMLSNSQNMVSQIVSSSVKFDQKNNLAEANSEIGRIVRSGASAEEVWRQAADRYAYGNVGFSGHSRLSNDAAMKSVIDYAVANQDINLLEQLRNTPKGPGLPPLGQDYGVELDNAIKKARQGAISEYNLGRNESAMESRKILDDYYANPTVENRVRAHEELMRQGTPEAAAQAAKLNEGGLRYDPVAAADFEKRIISGNPPSNDELQEALNHGLINSSEYRKLAKDPAQLALEKKTRTATTEARPKLDQMILGNVASSSQLRQVKTSDLNGTERAELGARQIRFRHEVNGAVNRALKSNPDIADDPLALNDLIFEEAQKLLAKPEYQMTGNTRDGWSFTADPVSRTGQNNPRFYVSSQDRNDFRKYNATQVINQAGVNPASISPTEDLIMSREDLKEDAKAMLAGKNPGVRLRQWSKSLGVTPRALLDAQLEQYKLPTLDGLRQRSGTMQEGGVIRDIPNEAAGFQHLKSMGFPTAGAAYIASAINHESTWHGLREWGQVANDGTSRNGGLISWAAWADDPARLGRIERHFGMNIAQIPESKQLDYMKLEMQKSYPQQYRVFMDPNASEADLRWAVRRYWGFDPRYTGNRWVDAERLRSRGS